MPNEQAMVEPYLRIIDRVTMQVNEIKQLISNPDHRLNGSDAKFQVGGQLAGLAEEFKTLAEEIEQT